MSIPEFRERLRKLHPIPKGILFTALTSLIFFIEIWLVRNLAGWSEEATEAYKLHDLDKIAGFFRLIIVAPLEEEIKYRGPVWILAMVIHYALKGYTNIWLKVLAYLPCIVLLFGLNYVWAFNHDRYPYTIFAFGIVWGGCVIVTRRLHYSMLFHAASNAFAAIGLCLMHYYSK